MICITNDMKRIRSCTVRGAHLESCLDSTCKGCAPREASFGFVCSACQGRIAKAMETHWDFTMMLSGVDVAMTSSGGGGGHSGPRLPFTILNLDRDELWSMLRNAPDTAAEWVQTMSGAQDAVRFAQAMAHAVKAHPWEESEAPVPITRCPKCAKRSLRWKPPADFLESVSVSCADARCGYSMGQDRFEVLADMEQRLTKGRRPLGEVELWVQQFREGRWSVWAGYPRWPSVDEVEARFGVEVWIDA